MPSGITGTAFFLIYNPYQMNNTKIRILETIRQGQIGGGESHLLNLVENLNKDQFEPIVLSFTDGPMVDRLQQMGIGVTVIPTSNPFDLSKWGKVKRFMQNNEISLVHAHGTRANSNVFWAAKRLHLPLVYTIHGWSFHDGQRTFIRRMRMLGENLLTGKSDVNISVSVSNQQTGKKHLNRFESVIVNYGIDQKKFDPNRSFGDIREELRIPRTNTLVLFVARFTHQKQPMKMLAAFAKAVKQMPSLRLLMVGDGDQKPRTLQLAQQYGIADKVIFQPFRQDVPDLLAAADIFVLPSLWEGLPIGLLEAMSMGKAVICTRVDGTPEVIQHNHNGLLISTNHLETELTDALVRLGGDHSLQQELGNQALATISSSFSAATMTRKIEAIYLKLLGRSSAGIGDLIWQ